MNAPPADRAFVPAVTLLTDFGVQDTYVGQVKGAILAVEPRAMVIDLTHAVPAQDVRAGAFLLWSAVQAFAAETIHLAVIDPGVGSARRPIAIRCTRGAILVGPDNGLLLPAADRLGGVEMAVELTEQRYWRPRVSRTFDGRDLFGPVAGHLAAGVPLVQLGPRVRASDLQHLQLAQPRGRQGEVIHVDTYGNLVTNIAASSLPPRFVVRLDGHLVASAAFYAAVEPGGLLALIGSAGLLEIAARDASAAAITGAARGAAVVVEPLD